MSIALSIGHSSIPRLAPTPMVPTTAPQSVLPGSDDTLASQAPATTVETSGPHNSMEGADLNELQAIDRRVRAHELAHSSVGGRYTGAPHYTFERGSNGVNYAVAGEVDIDTSKVAGDPEATMEKMRTVQAAALAPLDPSPQDRAVAATARGMEAAARYELLQQQIEAEPVARLDVKA